MDKITVKSFLGLRYTDLDGTCYWITTTAPMSTRELIGPLTTFIGVIGAAWYTIKKLSE